MIANRGEKDTVILRNILIVVAAFIGAGVVATSVFLQREASLEQRMYPHVYIDGKDVGGQRRDALRQAYGKLNRNLSRAGITILYNSTPIATFDAQTLQIRSNGPDIVDRAFIVGRTPNPSTRLYQKLTSLLNLGRFDFTTKIDYDISPIRDFMSDSEDHYNKPAKNALFTFENGKVTEFRQEEKGLKINTDQLYTQIDATIAKMAASANMKTVTLTDTVIDPEITLSEANKFGIEEEIAEGKSNYSGSIPSRVHNVILAASKFNGVLIPKGKTFSFDETLGDISANTGYEPAYVISNGKTVLGDGGGVCQVSTTMFRAAMNAGLPILERHAHAYRVHYYENDSEPGLDATIFSPSVDLKVQNDTPSDILILTHVNEETNELTFTLYGKKDGRKAVISKPVVSNYQPAPPPKYQDDPTLKKGITKQVDFAASGARATFTYNVTRDGKSLISDTFVSNYQPWQAVFLVGQAD